MAVNIINSLKNKYQGKKILVIGLGLQGGGVGVARFFAELGAKVTVTDKKPKEKLTQSIEKLNGLQVNFHLGEHNIKDFLNSDVIFKGPSVLWSMSEIVEAEKRGIPVEMELSFFSYYFPGKIIGITGTRGKTTTTYMIYQLLKQTGFSVYLGGGLPGISTINYLKTLGKDDWVVMELSSWALSGFHRKRISPHIAVFTNIYPDHLNYYKNMDEYLYDKKAIYLYQDKDDYLIFNKMLKIKNIKSRIIHFSKIDFPYKLKYIRGEHNLENAAASLKVASILGIDQKKAIEIISNFKGVPYRQEIIRKKQGIVFINDTTSTTPIATIKAIDSFNDKKIVLILGGNSKNLPTEDLLKNLKKVEKIVLLSGSFTDEIIDKLKKYYSNKLTRVIYDDLKKAVDEAYRLALRLKSKKSKKEICILFSPAATSFAMFNNEFHRGDEFNKIIKKFKGLNA